MPKPRKKRISENKVIGSAVAGAVLRQLADAHANAFRKKFAKRLQCLHAKVETLAHDHVKQIRAECEELLRMEHEVPHGDREAWQEEVANSLSLLFGRGTGYGLPNIRERLRMARRAVEEGPATYWPRAVDIMLDPRAGINVGRPNLQKLSCWLNGNPSVEAEEPEAEDRDVLAEVFPEAEERAADTLVGLREENEALRVEIDRLRAELATCRDAKQ